jgi:hypothetical protein
VKDDNDRLRAGELPTDPFEGTVSCDPPVHAAPPDARERLRTAGLTLPELLELEFPATAWLLEGFLQKDSTHCLFGPPNSGKTFLALEFIMRLLEQGSRVTLYEAEGSSRDLQCRLRRALAAHQIEHPEHLKIFHNADIDLTTEQGVQKVIEHADEHKPDLIVFDSLSAMAGNIDENDSAAMIRLSNALNRLKAEICAILVLHHMTKEGWSGDVPTLRSLRGHGSLPGRLDVAMAILPVEEETSERQVVFDLFEVKRRDEPKAGARRCTVAMPAAGPAARLEMVPIDAKAARAAVAGTEKASQIEGEMIEAVRSAMPAGLFTGELRSLVTGKSDDKAIALRRLLKAKRLTRGPPLKGQRTGRLVLGEGREPPDGAEQ